MSLAIQSTALHDPSPAPEQQLLISQPSASLAAAQSWDLTQFPHGFSSGEVCKGADGRWHLIPFGCGHTELPLDRREHKHPPAPPQNHRFALISWHFLMNPQCCSLQGWAAAPKNLSPREGAKQKVSLLPLKSYLGHIQSPTKVQNVDFSVCVPLGCFP